VAEAAAVAYGSGTPFGDHSFAVVPASVVGLTWEQVVE